MRRRRKRRGKERNRKKIIFLPLHFLCRKRNTFSDFLVERFFFEYKKKEGKIYSTVRYLQTDQGEAEKRIKISLFFWTWTPKSKASNGWLSNSKWRRRKESYAVKERRRRRREKSFNAPKKFNHRSSPGLRLWPARLKLKPGLSLRGWLCVRKSWLLGRTPKKRSFSILSFLFLPFSPSSGIDVLIDLDFSWNWNRKKEKKIFFLFWVTEPNERIEKDGENDERIAGRKGISSA